MIRIVLILLAFIYTAQASEVVWDGKNSGISQKEYDKAIKQYVDKTYSTKVRKWENYLIYRLNHPIDKYGNQAGYRYYNSGSMDDQGFWGGLWLSSMGGKYSFGLCLNSLNAEEYLTARADGFSVRCTKD